MAKHRRTTLLTFTSVLVALAPKCPVCFLAYFGIFGVSAATASTYRAWLPPITVIWLALTVSLLWVRTTGWRRYAPVAIGLVAAVGIFAARFVAASPRLIYLGIAMLVAAALWSSWLRTSVAAKECSDCSEEARLTIEERESPA